MLAHVWPPSKLNCHCTVGIGVPLAAAVNVAVAGARTVTSTGCKVTLGAVATGLTVKVAPLLTASGATPLLATASKTAPLQPSGTLASVSVALVEPLTVAPAHSPLVSRPSARLLPPRRHATVGDGVPVATTVKLADWPTAIVCDAGCVVNAGAVVAAVTVSRAGLLVTLAAGLLTRTR